MAIFFISVQNKHSKLDAKKFVEDAYSNCGSESMRSGNILCIKKKLEEPVIKNGIAPFVQAVNDLYFGNQFKSNAATQCHDVLHAIGQIGGANTNDLGQTISSCSDSCTYGCFHGIIEGYLMHGGKFIEHMADLCQQPACYHGLGHGVASYSGYNLKEALSYCDLIPQERFRMDCGSGVIMELYEQGSFDHTLLQWPDSIPEFCGELSDPYSQVCYTTAGLHEYGRSQNPAKAFTTCESVPPEYKNECNITIGRNYYYVFGGDESKIVGACQNNNSSIFLSCLNGSISTGLMLNSHSNIHIKICDLVDNKLKNQCLNLLN